MIRSLVRRPAGLLAVLTVPLAVASSALLVPSAAADVIATRDVTAGPTNRGVIEITAVTCERTDVAGDFGRLTISGSVLVPPTADDTVSIRVNDKTTHEAYALLPLASGATSFTTTVVADGLEPLPPMELVVQQRNPVTDAVSQRDRVVTNGRCGWPDLTRLPVPTARSVEFTGLVPTAVIANDSAFGLATNVGFTACARTAGTSECTITEAFTRVVVPAGGTVTATSPQAVEPGSVVSVQTGTLGRDLATSRYFGRSLMVAAPAE